MSVRTADPYAIRATRYIPGPTLDGLSEKQHVALWSHARELFYGGAAGGGKSEVLLAGALQYVDVPDYAAILFRRSYTDLSLPGALMDRSHEWLDGTEATWHDREHTWEFPSGATCSFGYLAKWRDKFRYRSAEFQYVGFDELTEFEMEDYLYVGFSRVRRPDSGPLSLVPLRTRSASNPGGPGHQWVKDRMVDKLPQSDKPKDVARAARRVFIPASLYDNAHIDQEAYVEGLEELDPQTAEQLIRGDWSVRPAGDWYFDHLALEACFKLGEVYDRMLERGELEPYGGTIDGCIDWGENTQGYAMWPLEGGGVYIPPSETVVAKTDPGESTRRMLTKWTRFGFPISAANYDAAGVQSMRTFVVVARELLPMLRARKIAFSKYKAETAKYLRLLTTRTGRGETTRVMPISPENKELKRQLVWLMSDPEDPNGAWLKEPDQHGPDAVIAGVAKIAQKHRALVAQELAKAAHTNGNRRAA